MSSKILWVHPFNGIAGDMMLGALIAAGVDAEELRGHLKSLEVSGWDLVVNTVERHGITATDATVELSEPDDHVHRRAKDIIAMIESSSLPDRVIDRSRKVFNALAQAEGEVHGVDPGEVHFHEVGGVDAIIDIVGACLGMELLGIDRVVSAPVAVGHGITRSAHGRIPHPAPATVQLLEGIPVRGIDVGIELTTPTGAAILAALADGFGPMPQMSIEASGFGAGDAEIPDHPNLLHVVLGDGPDVLATETQDHLVVIEANVDDLTGEYLAHTVTKLLDAGALDAWVSQIEMKRERPASVISALLNPAQVESLGEGLLEESGSLGYRAYGVDRAARSRTIGSIEVNGMTISIKESLNTVKAEYVDVVAAAKTLGRPARLIAREAEEKWRTSQDTGQASSE